MCTAFSWGEGRYFGRNLDLEYHYDEAVVTLGRAYPLSFRHTEAIDTRYAMIGIATVKDGYPLFYDGMNEHGLCMAALNFVGNAYYGSLSEGALNLAPYELIPYLLSRCRTVQEVKKMLRKISLVATPFSPDLPLAELHFLVSDKKESLVVEPRRTGVKCYTSSLGVLTNNPPYAFHLLNIQQYGHLSAKESGVTFSRGMSAFGLPGDASSASRFVRAAFVKENATFGENERYQVGQCFHILSSVAMVEGCIRLKTGMPKTVYSVCLDKNTCTYHVTTYENPTPLAVTLDCQKTFDERKIFS